MSLFSVFTPLTKNENYSYTLWGHQKLKEGTIVVGAVVKIIQVAPTIEAGVSGIVTAARAGSIARAATVANRAAFTAGKFSKSVATAANTIAIGNKSAILKSLGTELVADGLFETGEWAFNEFTDDDRDNVTEVQNDVAFATLDARAKTTTIEGNFSERYPANFSAALVSPFDIGDETTDGKKKGKARIVGFWGVHIEITSFDKSKLSAWQHPLERRNFGSIAFCRFDVPIQESSIHYSQQTILVPIVRALATGHVLGDVSQATVNRVHGSLMAWALL